MTPLLVICLLPDTPILQRVSKPGNFECKRTNAKGLSKAFCRNNTIVLESLINTFYNALSKM